MSRLGVTTPAFEPATCIAGTTPRSIVSDRDRLASMAAGSGGGASGAAIRPAMRSRS
jgi:hypothetical protein